MQSELTFKLQELSNSLVSYIASLKILGPFLRGFGQALEKGRVLFLVTTSTSPSLQAYAELHALSPLRGSINPCRNTPLICIGNHMLLSAIWA